MIHEMRLHNGPFQKIKSGTKTVELRLYDEKRRQIKKGDPIVFTNRADGCIINTIVDEVFIYPSFVELYKAYTPLEMGYDKGQQALPEDMEQYYSKQEQAQYGVMAIKIKLV